MAMAVLDGISPSSGLKEMLKFHDPYQKLLVGRWVVLDSNTTSDGVLSGRAVVGYLCRKGRLRPARQAKPHVREEEPSRIYFKVFIDWIERDGLYQVSRESNPSRVA